MAVGRVFTSCGTLLPALCQVVSPPSRPSPPLTLPSHRPVQVLSWVAPGLASAHSHSCSLQLNRLGRGCALADCARISAGEDTRRGGEGDTTATCPTAPTLSRAFSFCITTTPKLRSQFISIFFNKTKNEHQRACVWCLLSLCLWSFIVCLSLGQFFGAVSPALGWGQPADPCLCPPPAFPVFSSGWGLGRKAGRLFVVPKGAGGSEASPCSCSLCSSDSGPGPPAPSCPCRMGAALAAARDCSRVGAGLKPSEAVLQWTPLPPLKLSSWACRLNPGNTEFFCFLKSEAV